MLVSPNAAPARFRGTPGTSTQRKTQPKGYGVIEDQAVQLVRATVHGQRDLHLVIDGQSITLCGYVGDYPHRWQPERDTCGVCIRIAVRDGLVIPA